MQVVIEEFGESAESLRRRNHRPGRKTLALLAYEECRFTHRMIAEMLGISQPAVSQMLQTATKLRKSDRQFQRSVNSIRKLIN